MSDKAHQVQDTTIVTAAIHPAVGVARVGNSADEYYIGPEVYPTPVLPPGSYRDGSGALKRQAARFRVYGYNAAGEVVGELTPDSADIRWSAHVANHKAAWYDWVIALDIPEAADTKAPRRNAAVTGDKRAELVIDGGAVSIQGKGAQGGQYAFKGHFQGSEVYLGELRTDAQGHLLFLAGHGVSASPHNTPIFDPARPNAFINADGWHDDVCDGPVTAEVKIEGRNIPCESAWALSAPPDYAPNVVGVRTLYDLLYDLFIDAGWLEFPEEISFRRDVYPILHRLTGLGWVNKGFQVQFGLTGPHPFGDPDFVARLARKDKQWAELRRQIFNNFRNPDGQSSLQLPWAWIYGDAMEVPAGDSPRQNAAVSDTQYRILKLWAAGEFQEDWEETHAPPKDIDEIAPAAQPAMLDQAALEYCLADAFHPGCEVTWPVRHLSMWKSPFRLRHRPPGEKPPDYGPVMTQSIALSTFGPLGKQGPGDLTRWMGLPWQADTAYCRSGYDQQYDPYIPTFWPATVPNHVLTPQAYREVLDAKTPEERMAAFSRRFNWDLPLIADGQTGTAQQMKRMVDIFGSMGFLEVQPGPTGDPRIPAELMVASFGPDIKPVPAKPPKAEAPALKVSAAAMDVDRILLEAVAEDVNWTSAEEGLKAPLPVKASARK